MSPAPPAPIRTPCTKVCMVDGQSGLCLGCYRTLQEIATWSRLTDEVRADLMSGLVDRRKLIAPEKLGMV